MTNETSVQDLGAPKVDDDASNRVTISPEGEIIPADQLTLSEDLDDNQQLDPNLLFPRSTLEAIQITGLAPQEHSVAEDPSEHSGTPNQPIKRRRVAVDGPDDVATDLRAYVLRHAAVLPSDAIASALVDAASGVESPDQLLAPLAKDAVVRAAALRAVSIRNLDATLSGLADPSPIVRRAALDHLLDTGDAVEIERGLIACVESGMLDCVQEADKSSQAAREVLISLAASDALSR